MFSVNFYEKLIYKLLKKIEKRGDNVELYEKLAYDLLVKAGIGCGDFVDDSGEKGVFTLLKGLKAPFVVFDVGANVGKYADLVVSQLNFAENANLRGGGGTLLKA